MITKKLMHDIIAFCNNYIDNKNIIISITKYSKFIDTAINVWNVNNNGFIENCIGSIYSYIGDINDFNNFKEKVLNQLPLLLKQVKTN